MYQQEEQNYILTKVFYNQYCVLYGAEVWTLKKQSENKLVSLTKILRMTFGQIQEKGEWRIRKSWELRTLYKDPDIIALVKSKILRWLGNVQRRREYQICS